MLEEDMPIKQIQIINTYEKRYTIDCPNGYGYMNCIRLAPGISVIYNDFHCFESPESNSPFQTYLEINHCLSGKFECVFNENYYGYLNAGDLAINQHSINRKTSGFPLGYYYGIEILIDIEKAKNSTLLKQFHIDIERLMQKVIDHHGLFIDRSNKQIEHILLEMYDIDEAIKVDYLSIKVLELLLYLSHKDFEMINTHIKYYDKKQIEKIRLIKKYLIEHLDQKIDFQALANVYHINLNTLRKSFKDIYGKPIYQWYKEYRLKEASILLSTTNLPIIDIASQVGYDNPSKFSAAFCKHFGQTPIAYRKTKI